MSQKEKNILYINTHMWNLENSKGEHIFRADRDTDIDHKCMDTKKGRAVVGWNGRLGLT